MKQFNRTKGSEGEEIAVEYLRTKGYQILEKNYSVKFGEIDLIIAKDNVLVFVEVKLKTTDDFGTPEEMIGKGKLYLMQNPEMESLYDIFRIDAVCIVGLPSQGFGEVKRISHYENITF